MNKFKFYFILIFSGLVLFSCKKDDDSVDVEPLRDYKTQDIADMDQIKTYMKTHYIKTLTASAGSTSDMDVVIDTILATNTEAVSLWNRIEKDSIQKELNDITYTIYYLKLREGDATQESPSRVDKILAAYDGYYLSDYASSGFEYTPFPTSYVGLDGVITGWTEIFPKFKPGIAVVNPGQPTVYDNFGAGIMFVPSGLAYYNFAQTAIPSYVPLMFTFKLYLMERADQDGDGILSIYEDRNGNGIFTDDDTDGDGIADYVDPDDDGDGKTTREETKIPGIFPAAYYPYNGALTNDPVTPYDETLGIPNCAGDYTTPMRLRKYLDPSCQ